MARMYGKLGWNGQCKCCCGNAGKDTVRHKETMLWRKDWDHELSDIQRDAVRVDD